MTLREAVREIQSGNNKVRDFYINYYYDYIRKALKRLRIPKRFHDDLTQECIIEILNTLKNFNLDRKARIEYIIFSVMYRVIYNYLKTVCEYKAEDDGKFFSSPFTYMNYEVGYSSNHSKAVKMLLENARFHEDISISDGTLDDYPSFEDSLENKVIDGFVSDAYEEFVSLQSPRSKRILMGRLSMDDFHKEGFSDIADDLGSYRQSVEDSYKTLIGQMRKFAPLMDIMDLPEDSIEQKEKLKRERKREVERILNGRYNQFSHK